MFVPTALIAAFSIPLVLKLVPPNRIYGVRTTHTLASPEVWFRVNRFAGLALVAASGLATGAYLVEPELTSGRSFLGMLVLVIPVVLALAVTAVYARDLERRKNSHRPGS